MTIGERIKDRRTAAHMTMEELGNRLGVTKTTIFKYENGEIVNIPLPTIRQIATILDCTPAFLMGWENNDYSGEIESDAISAAVRKMSIAQRKELLKFMRYWYPEAFQS